jgi:membrane-associated HD superfamily phosphohydrolase
MQPAHQEVAEEIVRQEREAKSQMPTYKGLEAFKLVEKMGEFVSDSSIIPYRLWLTEVISAVPFLMYIKRQTPKRANRSQVLNLYIILSSILTSCPVKVVRKFEMNSSQVSVRFLFPGTYASILSTTLPSSVSQRLHYTCTGW